MPVKPVPDGYHTVTPYLIVPGAARLIDFLKLAFEAKERYRSSRPDGAVMHAEITIGDSVIMMGEPMGEFQPMPSMIHLYVENCDAVYKQALKAGAMSVMEPADQFYGDRSGGVKDAFGNLWWIATRKENVSPEELEKRAQDTMKQQQALEESARRT